MINKERLRTIANYAKMRDVTPETVYRWIRTSEVDYVEIDGKKFIYLKEDELI